MPNRKQTVKKRSAAKKSGKKRQNISKKSLDDRSILVNLLRDTCYRYGLAMAKFEFKGKLPKPSIDEFRERIAHHMNLIQSSLEKKFSENAKRSLKQASAMLATRLRLDVEKIRNGINMEVETIYDSLK